MALIFNEPDVTRMRLPFYNIWIYVLDYLMVLIPPPLISLIQRRFSRLGLRAKKFPAGPDKAEWPPKGLSTVVAYHAHYFNNFFPHIWSFRPIGHITVRNFQLLAGFRNTGSARSSFRSTYWYVKFCLHIGNIAQGVGTAHHTFPVQLLMWHWFSSNL